MHLDDIMRCISTKLENVMTISMQTSLHDCGMSDQLLTERHAMASLLCEPRVYAHEIVERVVNEH